MPATVIVPAATSSTGRLPLTVIVAAAGIVSALNRKTAVPPTSRPVRLTDGPVKVSAEVSIV